MFLVVLYISSAVVNMTFYCINKFDLVHTISCSSHEPNLFIILGICLI